MAFIGLFKKHGLENLEVSKVRDDLRDIERLETQLGRRLTSNQDTMERLKLFTENEKNVTEAEIEQAADQMEEIEFDIAAIYQELSKVRQEKRAVKGILILLERQSRLKSAGVWERITKMNPEKLEESLRNLGDMDSSVSENVDLIRETLGVPATPKDIRMSWSPRKRQIMEDIKAKRAEKQKS